MTDEKHKRDDKKFFDWLTSSLKEKEEICSYSLSKIFNRLMIREEEISFQTKKEMWEEILLQCKPTEKKRTIPFTAFIKYAAVIILLLLPLTYIYYISDTVINETDYLSIMQEYDVNTPTTGNITLILPDNQTLEINEDNAELVHDETGEILINGNEPTKTIDTTTPQWLQLHVPYGKSTRITMSDGTQVWVNSGTRLVYPAHFIAGKREIYVEGEIFLDVTENREAPFIIKTDLLEVTVLGTTFNVSAYKNDPEQSVVLASGKVNIKSGITKEEKILAPSQRYVFDKNTSRTYLNEVDINEYISWKHGYLYLKDEPLTSLIQKIERYYNIRIEYDPVEIQQIRVSGKLDLKENIEELLDIICVTTPIKYILHEKHFKIIVKPLK